MTLTEAIKHCEDVADYDCFTDDQRKCSDEHRQLADWLRELKERREKDMEVIKQLSSAESEHLVKESGDLVKDLVNDCISRQDAIDAIHEDADWLAAQGSDWQVERMERDKSILMSLPSAEKVQLSGEDATFDYISRQAAIDALYDWSEHSMTDAEAWHIKQVIGDIKSLPSAQPERTCVNCGRTANNGGWYADGGTRCPIEEHYALPKDGFCHLWEKRNVTDDDYPERRTDGRD